MSDENGNARITGEQTASGEKNGGQRGGESQSPLMLIARWVGTGAVAFFTLKALFSGAFWATVLGIVLTVSCYYLIPLAWWLGDAFRRFVRPDFYLTSSTSDLFYQRIFWMVGPQLVATFFVCLIPMAILNKSTEATRINKAGNAALKKLDKYNKEQAVEMEKIREEEANKKAEVKETESKIRKEYAALMTRSDNYPAWTDEQKIAYREFRKAIESYKTSNDNQQQEVESNEEFEKRQAKNFDVFAKKLKKTYGKVLGEGKCFVLRNTCYLDNIHLNKAGNSLSKEDDSLLFEVRTVESRDLDDEARGYFGSAPVKHVKILDKVYVYEQGAVLNFSLDDAKKVQAAFGGTFSDPSVATEHLRIDEVIRVRAIDRIESLGYAVSKRTDEDRQVPSENMVRAERERQSNENVKRVVEKMNIRR